MKRFSIIFWMLILTALPTVAQQFIGCRVYPSGLTVTSPGIGEELGWAETPMLRKTFNVSASDLKHHDFQTLTFSVDVTSLGYHEVYINGKKVGDIGYLFCDDDYLIEVNRTYLNHDTYTDIITFDYVEKNVISGDIMISVERVRENATVFETSFEDELHRVIIHGVLHLLGQGDKTKEEAEEMRKKESDALELWKTVV